MCDIAAFNFKTNDFRGLSLEEILFFTKLTVETEIPKLLEVTTTPNLKKKIKDINLKKELNDFTRKNITLNEREKYIYFLKDFVSSLYSTINKHGEIFETEELDRTKEKHRRHLKEIIPNVNKIFAVELVLRLNKKYKRAYRTSLRASEFYSQQNL